MKMDTQNTKKELPVNCSCGAEGVVMLDVVTDDYNSTCSQCQIRLYGVTCQSCESGYCFPENDKNIDLNANTWVCDICGKTNTIGARTLENTVLFAPKPQPTLAGFESVK